ncbi:type II secretion system minor pseudopilin GspK [Vibrio tapetis subsp. quintayensis]|uniref:type II secretion system minor pseudopilin GspK n=1 Tax=Vibrio tapetis TaxID=52443 RepID=UPI0025B62988|nr:type II secretion system minor pseudopilin GspK [Vibrio tapetis]MDN3679549.1 type II secretion system minor pseudopilin GspK [Vibrio tapetis subsp. quintayensis]
MRANNRQSYPNTGRHKQSGVALIMVLLLLAVMTAIAATMSERLFTNFKRATSQVNHQQAYWYSVGVEALAKAGIEQSYKDNDTINLSQPWAIEEQQYPLDYGQAIGKVVDKQACFNLNVLASDMNNNTDNQSPYLVKVLRSLLEQQGVEPYLSEVISDSSWEFVDSNSTVQSNSGAEDSTYESMQPPYLAPNGFIADSSEFRAVNQVSNEIMHNMSPLLCALPTKEWKLNVNTIDEKQSAILVALFQPYLSEQNAKELVNNRKYDGWQSVDDFLAEASVSSVNENTRKLAKPYLSVDSQYFEVDAQILVEQSRVRLRSLLYSKDKKKTVIVRRRFGGMSERVSDRQAK